MVFAPATQSLLIWIIIGALAGTLTSMLFYRKHMPITDLSSLGLGLLGALLGRVVFDLLRIQPRLPALVLSVDDLLAAVLGSLLVLLLFRYLQR